MELNILISCMFNDPIKLIDNSNIDCNAIIIDQCDNNFKKNMTINGKNIKYYQTTERGLSKSRNMAIKKSNGDICLICDDDELFVDNLEEIICNAYEDIPDADIIIFSIGNYPKSIKKTIHEMKKLELLKVSSWQISFRRNSVLNSGVLFDQNIGSGTGNGGGEEIKFLLDCYKKGLKIYFVPENICDVNHNESQWFFGYNENYFVQRGATTCYYMGNVLAFFYGIYFVMTKRNLYKANLSSFKALKCIMIGMKRGIKLSDL
ncbi:glycosyltransferase family A protein [Clostridium paraputrificum]|uniref:glycosyltransferase family A protein n=1 Tax=Clostridium paraputrificum TaxID=29363 RepID=UPI001FAB13BE|nr:glycosyltransferase family A protein [Clostridium paraputrificum]